MSSEWQPRDNIAHARATGEKFSDTTWSVVSLRPFALLSLRLNLRLIAFVEINHVHAQKTEAWSWYSRHKLFTIVIQVEVEWISGI